MATIEERFNAAVNVIKNLPKNGSYQPSSAMMLTFYGYYKQATEGPCHQRKPNFWDVVGKAKWDAWNANRHLTKDRAMQLYVDELRKIIETMSFTDNVAEFVGSISELDAVSLDDLEAVSPGIKELAKSHPNSPFSSRANSPHHGASANSSTESWQAPTNNNLENHVNQDENSKYFNGRGVKRLDTLPIGSQLVNGSIDSSGDEYDDPVDAPSEIITTSVKQNTELLKQVNSTVQRMNADLIAINRRLDSIETCLQRHKCLGSTKSNRTVKAGPLWWPFVDISPTWFVILILWPFLVKRISRLMLGQRRK